MANTFTGIVSSPYHLESQMEMVNLILGKFLSIAQTLLLPFLLIRLLVHYVQFHLSPSQLIKSCYTSLLSLCLVLVVLHYYIPIFNLLDRFTAVLMDQLDWRQLKKIDNLETSSTPSSIFHWLSRLCSNFSLSCMKSLSGLISLITTLFRQQAIVFALQVGPLALASSILPGNFSQIATYWFNMLLSFLMWGLTIELLDYTTLSIDLTGLDGLASALSSCLLYGLVGPLTSIYIGNTVGNSLFSLGQTKKEQFHRFVYGRGIPMGLSLGKRMIKPFR